MYTGASKVVQLDLTVHATKLNVSKSENVSATVQDKLIVGAKLQRSYGNNG